MEIRSESSWAKRSMWAKRLHGFVSYLCAALAALIWPVEADKAMFSTLKDQFEDGSIAPQPEVIAGVGAWLPIETAPANEVVDLFVPWKPNSAGFKGFRFTDCYRREDGQWTSKNFDSEKRRTINNPSHWMRRPDAPNQEIDRRQAQTGAHAPGCRQAMSG